MMVFASVAAICLAWFTFGFVVAVLFGLGVFTDPDELEDSDTSPFK